jgi:hypothetical protein
MESAAESCAAPRKAAVLPSDAGATTTEEAQTDKTDKFGLERVLSSLRLVASIAAFALVVAVSGAGLRDGLEMIMLESGAARAGFDSVLFHVDVLAREPVIVRYDDDVSFKEMTRYGLQGWVPSICFFPVCIIAL